MDSHFRISEEEQKQLKASFDKLNFVKKYEFNNDEVKQIIAKPYPVMKQPMQLNTFDKLTKSNAIQVVPIHASVDADKYAKFINDRYVDEHMKRTYHCDLVETSSYKLGITITVKDNDK